MYNSMCLNACTSLLEDIAVVDGLKVNAQNPELSMASILGLLVRMETQRQLLLSRSSIQL